MDRRDVPTWIAIELTYQGEARVEDATLEGALRQDLGVDSKFPIFVPAATYRKGARAITLYLMEGYVFVGSGLLDTAYFALEKKSYIARVMSEYTGPHKLRVVSTISNDYIQDLRKQLRKIVCADVDIDSMVRVADGTFKALIGQVMCVRDDYAQVLFRLRSLNLIASIPLAFLEIL